MSATEELRRMLDERGVEYYKHEDDEPLRKLVKADKPATSWRIGGASVCAVPIEGSDLFDLWVDHCTPEQAIEATLGRGMCVPAELDCIEDRSRWFELFGTPERAARTLKEFELDQLNWCRGTDCCEKCPYEFDRYGCCLPDGFALLEWLRGDAE